MSNNSDIFSRLLDSTFTVDIKRGDKSYALVMRELPFSTFMFIATEYTAKAKAELLASRREIMEHIGTIGHIIGADLDKLIDSFTPLAMTAIFELPGAVERIVMDTVVDITPEQVKLLTSEDITCIIYAVVERTDVKRIADKVSKIFFRVRDVVQLVQNQLPKETSEPQTSESTENELNTQEQP